MKKLKLLFLILAFASASNTTFATPGDTLTVSPNPFDSITVIHFEIGANDTISLDVLSMSALVVKTYFNATVLPVGSYSLNFNGDTLPNGMYLVRLKINSTTKVQKIIKISNLGLKENMASSSNKLLFPNPTTAILEIPIEGTKTIIVTDLSGRIVLNATIQTNSISLANLENGKYIVSVYSENKELITSQQIVKTSN